MCVAEKMNKYLCLVLCYMPLNLPAQDSATTDLSSGKTPPAINKTVKSPQNRVALLELYTSEGCSSCPPADRFLSELKGAGISDRQLIPMAFHVTYWDFIGWKDRFANEQFDYRQQDRAKKNKQATVYTPQFVFSGEDYRRYARFSEDIKKVVAEKSTVDLVLTANKQADKLILNLKSDVSKSSVSEISFYIAVTENNLSSAVDDGENEGSLLQHDYVVRELSGPYYHDAENHQLDTEYTVALQDEWKRHDLSIVAFAESTRTGEILQAVKLKY